jgi:hypothetical protein
MSEVEEEDAGSIPSRAMRFLGVVLGPGVSIRIASVGSAVSRPLRFSALFYALDVRLATYCAAVHIQCSHVHQ